MYSILRTVIFFTALAALGQARNIFDGPCGEGQELSYGKCIPIASDAQNELENTTPFNIITVPPNCPPGQQWINGKCRDVWIKKQVFSDCLESKIFEKEKCFKALQSLLSNNMAYDDGLPSIRNIITVPGNCPSGQQLVNGVCRDVWSIILVPNNIITVPDNCPTGQQLVNGVCTEIWTVTFVPNNIIVAPGNCPNGQQLVNGVCRDIWLLASPNFYWNRNIITAPDNCPTGQQLVNGVCRDVWSVTFNPSNVIGVPDNCPKGQQLVNGVCTEIWVIAFVPNNIIVVPGNCPTGQQLVNGVCRDIWLLVAPDSESEARNIITVPNQCPTGYVPDANGVCRKEFRH